MDLNNNLLPLVTIAIPLYNQEDYIGQTINSIIKQTYTNFEIIVYDDNSNDRSREVVEKFKDPRLTLIPGSKRLGPEGNWNRCLSKIRGDFYILVPGDDILYPSYLAKMVGIMTADTKKAIALVGCARRIIDSHGTAIYCRSYPGKTGLYAAHQVLRQTFLFGTNVIGEPASALMRSKVARSLACYQARPGYLIDLDFWIRALDFGAFYYLDEALCGFRISRTSWSARIGFRQRHEFIQFIRRIIKERNLHPRLWEWMAVYTSSWINLIGRMAFFAAAHLKLKSSQNNLAVP